MKFQLSLKKKSDFKKDKRKNASLISDQIKDILLVYLLWKSYKKTYGAVKFNVLVRKVL